MALNSAVVGLGHSGPRGHLPALSRNPRTDLVAVCDLEEGRVRAYADEYDVRGFSDVDSMLDSCDLDWVHVCTPVQSHFGLAKRAIESGAHVLVQKPATADVAEFGELVKLARESGVQLSVVHNQRFIPVIRAIERRIGAGELGTICAVETVYSGEGRPDVSPRGEWVYELVGGELEEGVPHPIYLTLATGGYPRDEAAISTTTRALDEYGHGIGYDGMGVEYVADNGSLCTIKVLAEGVPQRTVTVHGDRGSVHIDLISMNVRTYDRMDDHITPRVVLGRSTGDMLSLCKGLVRNSAAFGRYFLENTFDLHSESSVSGTYYQINENAKSLQQGTDPPVSTEEARWTLEIMEQVRGGREDQ